jgi:hypothetical protein
MYLFLSACYNSINAENNFRNLYVCDLRYNSSAPSYIVERLTALAETFQEHLQAFWWRLEHNLLMLRGANAFKPSYAKIF